MNPGSAKQPSRMTSTGFSLVTAILRGIDLDNVLTGERRS